MTDPQRWQRIQHLFDGAVGLPAGERERFLVVSCGADLDLRRDVQALLDSDAQSDDFIERVVGGAAAAVLSDSRVAAGQRIGRYRVLRELGRGGMGAVYLAERADREYRKQVAIKLVHGGADPEALRRRLRDERQILADLDHPNIARLLDGGTTDGETTHGAVPFVVMEYVEGERIDRYCDRRNLSIDERIRLVLAVCAAVEYAHRKLVVHRDIKPGNILVTPDGVPKLLDFGIAKLLDPDQLGHTPAQTSTQIRLMTPWYASPEQIRGQRVSTATDIYSLGAVLFELLAGRSPYRLASRNPFRIAEAICTQVPETPAAALVRPLDPGGPEADAAPAEQIARARGMSVRALLRRLGGDIAPIVQRALGKEVDRRYASVEQLSEDLRRHLLGLPVVAAAGGWSYRATRFVTRHRWSAAAGSILALLLAAATFIAVAQARRAARERDVAALERTRAEETSRFLTGLFQFPATAGAAGEALTVRQALDAATARLDTAFADRPDLQARLLRTIGNGYAGLGETAAARRVLETALAREREAGSDSAEVAATLEALAAVLRRGLAAARALAPHDPALVAELEAELGNALAQLGRGAAPVRKQ